MISLEELIALSQADWHNLVRETALEQRAETMVAAVSLAESIGVKRIIETGCMRGIIYDGSSTLILAMLAARLGARLSTYDINPEHIAVAMKSLGEFSKFVRWHTIDSVVGLCKTQVTADFVYLDSYDYDAANSLPCQLHQLAEVGAIYGKLASKAIIFLDDCDLPNGGKSAISTQFLVERGWKIVADKYQRILVNYEHDA